MSGEFVMACVVIIAATVLFLRTHSKLVRHMTLQQTLELCAKAWARGETPPTIEARRHNITGALYSGPALTPVRSYMGSAPTDLSAFAPEASKVTIKARAHTGGGHVRVPWRVAEDRCGLSNVLLYVCLDKQQAKEPQQPPTHRYVIASALG